MRLIAEHPDPWMHGWPALEVAGLADAHYLMPRISG
jgi:hypothetical protein